MNQRRAITPTGNRSRNDPARQIAWTMTSAATELGKGVTLVSAFPEIDGTAVESDRVAVMSTKKTPRWRCQLLQYRSLRLADRNLNAG